MQVSDDGGGEADVPFAYSTNDSGEKEYPKTPGYGPESIGYDQTNLIK